MMVVTRYFDPLQPIAAHYLLRDLKDQSLHLASCEVDKDVRWFFVAGEVEESHAFILANYEVVLRLDLDGLANLAELLEKNGMKTLDLQML